MLDPLLSRRRQQRLLDVMAEARLDAVVVGLAHHVYYLSAYWTDWHHQSAFILLGDGRSILISPNTPHTNPAVDEAMVFEANWNGTLRQEQPATVATMALQRLVAAGRRHIKIGVDSSAVTAQLALRNESGTVDSIDAHLWQMRRRKDADELSLIKTAIAASEAMYAKAREMIEPGLAELDLYNALHTAAVSRLGEPMKSQLGNDFVCGEGGGAPRRGHAAKAGELWVLDLSPNYRGYFADTCRAFAVGVNPTDEQARAWQAVCEVLQIVEKTARPGVRCRDLYSAADDHLRSAGYKEGMTHHLGHGIGLQPHEYPHLNPKWDDVLMEGEVFAVEPGLYGAALRSGLRLENNYVVTADGVENLVNFPLDL